jgi:hypothetical protein
MSKQNASIYVAAYTVDHGPCHASAMGGGGQKITPHRRVHASLVVEHHYVAATKIIDLVGHSPRPAFRRNVTNRECTPGQAE